MNDNNITLTLPNLILKVAAAAKIDPATSRRLIHKLFSIVEEQLIKGDTVIVHGLGEFSYGSDENPVIFKPDPALAALVNAPFSAFTPVEMNNGAEKELVKHPEPEPEPAVEETAAPIAPEPEEKPREAVPAPVAPVAAPPAAANPAPAPAPAPQPAPTPAPAPVQAAAPAPEPQPQAAEKPQPAPQPVANISEKKADDEATVPYLDEPQPQKQSHTIWLVLGIMIGLVAGLIGGYFAGREIGRVEGRFGTDEEETEQTEINEESIPSDSIAEDEPSILDEPADTAAAQAAPEPEEKAAEPAPQATPQPAAQAQPAAKASNEPVYDKVTSTLTALAQKHYGNKEYWVFIYKANPHLGNPNQVRPGTSVTIPPLSSFAGATTAETRAKAQKLLNEISAKHK